MKRYNSFYFGKEIYSVLENLGDEEIIYVIGSLRFEREIKKRTGKINSIPNYTH